MVVLALVYAQSCMVEFTAILSSEKPRSVVFWLLALTDFKDSCMECELKSWRTLCADCG